MTITAGIEQAVAGTVDAAIARQLLLDAAMVTMQTQGAYTAKRTTKPLPDRYRRDERPVCDDTALHYLDILLDAYDHRILWQWTTLIEARGERAPDEYLPRLLDAGEGAGWMMPHLKVFFGRRGLWLAQKYFQQQPGWRWITEVRQTPEAAERSNRRVERNIIRYMRDNRHNLDLDVWQQMEQLVFREHPWDDIFTQSVVIAVKDIPFYPRGRIWDRSIMPMIAHYALPKFRKQILKALRNQSGIKREERDYIDMVMRFREQLCRNLDGSG